MNRKKQFSYSFWQLEERIVFCYDSEELLSSLLQIIREQPTDKMVEEIEATLSHHIQTLFQCDDPSHDIGKRLSELRKQEWIKKLPDSHSQLLSDTLDKFLSNIKKFTDQDDLMDLIIYHDDLNKKLHSLDKEVESFLQLNRLKKMTSSTSLDALPEFRPISSLLTQSLDWLNQHGLAMKSDKSLFEHKKECLSSYDAVNYLPRSHSFLFHSEKSDLNKKQWDSQGEMLRYISSIKTLAKKMMPLLGNKSDLIINEQTILNTCEQNAFVNHEELKEYIVQTNSKIQIIGKSIHSKVSQYFSSHFDQTESNKTQRNSLKIAIGENKPSLTNSLSTLYLALQNEKKLQMREGKSNDRASTPLSPSSRQSPSVLSNEDHLSMNSDVDNKKAKWETEKRLPINPILSSSSNDDNFDLKEIPSLSSEAAIAPSQTPLEKQDYFFHEENEPVQSSKPFLRKQFIQYRGPGLKRFPIKEQLKIAFQQYSDVLFS